VQASGDGHRGLTADPGAREHGGGVAAPEGTTGAGLEAASMVARVPPLRLSRLPPVTIIDASGERTVDLAAAAGRVEFLSRRLEEMFPAPGSRVGIIYPMSPMLPLIWLALLRAGKVPCILQTPTEKQTGDYWLDSVSHAVRTCGLAAVLGGGDAALSRLNGIVDLRQADWTIASLGEAAVVEDEIRDGSVLQLSSGTTGHKKGVPLSIDHLRRHVECYNALMHLGRDDRIVSWLPLYHDMGFIACFVMPLFLGVPIVLIDPMVWVRQPSTLFQAIARHGGTVCYMPNFGFEVMCRADKPAALGSMRHWISCSEPSYEDTLRRFAATTGTSPERISTCYGMAENVFAVAQSRGLRLLEGGGRSLVSCGRPIPGTDIKIVEGEIWVRSASSLRRYVGQPECVDADGYYATGDLGVLSGGELAILGRKHDVIIVAGKKYLLNDLDHVLNQAVPDCKGRGAALAQDNALIGTQSPLYLVERARFWAAEDRNDSAEHALRAMTGIEVHRLESVPPKFITKTSSGKINRRKTLADWQRSVEWRGRDRSGDGGESGLRRDVEQCFSSCPTHVPLTGWLDSLGQVVMRMLFENHGVRWNPHASLEEVYRASVPGRREDPANVFRIVSLFDLPAYPFLTESLVQEMSLALGAPVHFEQVCAPPSSVLLHDLIFHDYFLPRFEDGRSAFTDVVRKLKNASLILVDDLSEFWMPNRTRWSDIAYGRLNHSLANDPAADLVGVRRARYHARHQLLPRELVLAGDLPLESRSYAIRHLSDYLNVPVLRFAFHEDYRPFTLDWEERCYQPDTAHEERTFRFDPARFRDAVVRFSKAHATSLRPGRPGNVLDLTDQGHYCSILVNQAAVDWIAARHRRFWICGLPCSVPYLESRLRALGREYFYWNSLSAPARPFDCVVQNGSWGMPQTAKPVYDLVIADRDRNRPFRGGEPTVTDCPAFRDLQARVTTRQTLRQAGVPDREGVPGEWPSVGLDGAARRDQQRQAIRSLAGRVRARTGGQRIRLLEISNGTECWQMACAPVDGVAVITLEPDPKRAQALRRAVPGLDLVTESLEHHRPHEPYHGVFAFVPAEGAAALQDASERLQTWLVPGGEVLLQAL
jgi:acyl-CoA synthetase (AMP-forming)/AMP-acid ligase II